MSSQPSTVPPTESVSGSNTTLGSAVHLIGLLTWVIGPGIVYAVSDDSFVRENARNALNWHIIIFAIPSISLALAFIAADVFVIVGAVVAILGGVCTFPFSVIAAIKARRGKAWTYPFAPSII